MSSLIGKPLQGGKYKLETVLGRGGFGLTFRAHQTYLDTVVVVKTLNEAHWQAPNIGDLQQQFQDEARRLAMCSHPNVVRVSDFFTEDGLPYMVMDYIPGRSLYDIVIPGNPLPVKAAVSYITQIGSALQAVHAKGLLHRDVKPQNIMVHELTGNAILIDFGIARELTQNPAQTHTSIVSEGYAPIEQYLPKAHRSAATDIYGLATTLYTLLTAEIPTAAVLRDRDPIKPIRQLRPDISDGMAMAIEQGMNIELRDRPQSVGRWLTMLSQKSTQRSSSGSSSAPIAASRPSPPPSPSEYPTKVVAPAYNQYSAQSSNSQAKTIAVPLPTEDYSAANQSTYAPIEQNRSSKKGLSCFSLFGLLVLVTMGAFAAGGFWLFKQLSESTASLPGLPLPEIDLPGDLDEGLEADDPAEDESETDSDDTELVEDDDERAEDATEIEDSETTESEDVDTPVESEDRAQSDTSQQPRKSTPPLILGNSGDPTGGRSGDLGESVPVYSFSPGTEEDKILAELGAPTRTSNRDGFYTSAYVIEPNRVTLGYVYDEGSTQVRQAEATFPASTSVLVMQTTLVDMMGNSYSNSAVDGLRALHRGERDRVNISTGNLTGAIERNSKGYIHIYVRR